MACRVMVSILVLYYTAPMAKGQCMPVGRIFIRSFVR